jgi:hypothetical protein
MAVPLFSGAQPLMAAVSVSEPALYMVYNLAIAWE